MTWFDKNYNKCLQAEQARHEVYQKFSVVSRHVDLTSGGTICLDDYAKSRIQMADEMCERQWMDFVKRDNAVIAAGLGQVVEE